MQAPKKDSKRLPPKGSEFVSSLRTGVLLGIAMMVLMVPVQMHRAKVQQARLEKEEQALIAQQQARDAQQAQRGRLAPAPQAGPAQPEPPALRLADFRGEKVSPDARLVANWAVATQNNGKHALIVVDKKDARVYVFSPQGALVDSAPALLGAARGDDSYPGIGDKPLQQVQPYEKTTPAGRFVAEIGANTGNEDVIWVDYDAAVSMHRVRPLVARERRLERLATLTTDDNRISFGCINLPVSFYENVANPAVRKYGAIIYVLPDVKTPQEVFGAYDVTDPIQVAAAGGSAGVAAMQKVALGAGAATAAR